MERKTMITSNGIEEANVDNSWRKNFQTKKILEKWRIALEEEIFTDIALYVGPEKEEIKCHRLILKLQSERFADLLSNDANEYHLENFDPKVFRKFLKYLYTDQFQLNGAEAILMMHIAKQFEMSELSKKCGEQVHRDIDVENAAFILEQAKILKDKDLGLKTQAFILQHAEEVFKTDGFNNLSIECVRGLIKSKERDISEVNAFEAVRRWAIADIERQSMEVTGENVYYVAEKVFDLIDFSKFSSREFSEHVVLTKSLPTEMLLSKLTELSLKKVDGPEEPSLMSMSQVQQEIPMPTAESNGLNEKSKLVVERYANTVHETWPDTTNGIYKVSFKANKSISVEGVELYGWKNEEEKLQDITVQLTDYDESATYASIEKTCHLPPPKDYINVEFANGFSTEKDIWYTIIVTVKGPLCSYGSGGKKKYTVSLGEEQFIFELKNSLKVNGPSHLRGQIPRILFSSK